MLALMHEVSKRYGRKGGVESLSFELPEGQVVGLLGLNGAGKSTTLRLLAGLLIPTSGQVRILGRLPRQARGQLAYLSENDILYPWMTPSGARRFMQGLFPDFRPKRFTELLAFLEVPNRAARHISRGQRGRLRLAMILAREARLYLLDEPLSGIDLISRERILSALVREWRAEATVVLSTHEVHEAEGLFDRAIFIKEGHLVLDASSKDLHSKDKSVVDTFKEVLA